MRGFILAILAVAAAVAAAPVGAQQFFDTPRVSPAASVTQRVGITDITVTYHRPGVKNRDIWGALVPYDQVWRAGANENTTISFTHPVLINDTRLDAGTYGLHVLPTDKDWTFILSRQSRAWGSFSYDEAEDAVRVTVTPVEIPHEEYLTYSFDNPTRNEVDLTLSWEMLEGKFSIWVDTDEIVAADLRDGLRGRARFSADGWRQAADWCLQNDTNLEEAMEWVDRSIRMQRSFGNLRVKAGLLERQGHADEAEEIMESALEIATEGELNRYGYQLMGAGDIDAAIEVFRMNVDRHPNSWNCWDSLGEAYLQKGNKKKAIKFYEEALLRVDDEQQETRIRSQLSTLRE